ncbi:hypothetical protein DL240_01730 [Lujinxingia litoralis]|uniref:Helicase XPB/Ssl2 N-terminal domain-containing protein n=1 Tax=Lujinxingia litoralis TaxID=2211119 RepID=A0A328C919_9DELT|nr:helicase-associated domain-containing protein [Lujinxingia litoralis]RAL24955.1 hypothetical protein DL240_01730 [Lujinxingia litoralis]
MSLRPDRPLSQGPLDATEFTALRERGYADASLRFLARAWEVSADPEDLCAALTDPHTRALDTEALSEIERAVFWLIQERGGRARGENLRRDLLLRGFGESEPALAALIATGWLIPIPAAGEHDCDIEVLLERGTFLQHDLALSAPTLTRLDARPDALDIDVPGWTEVSLEPTVSSVDDLELNLLHLASLIRRDPLKLNKDGTPNRRSLARSARGISMPGQLGEVAGDLDLHDPRQLDFLTFLAALGRELGFLEPDDDRYRTHDGALSEYFHASGAERDRRLAEALQKLRFWNEVQSVRLADMTLRGADDQHFSQHESTGEPLIGARGFVLSVLRRASVRDWVSLDALTELCTQIDRQYLDRTLSKMAGQCEPAEFIEAMLERTLSWSGILQFGRATDGQRVARLSPRGARALGLEGSQLPPPQGGCLIVQPNFEVMVFLDNAPVAVLHDLYRVGERRKLSDRVATFQLATESVQRGYSLGASAQGLVELLNRCGHTPVPEAVAFQLKDWERVHQRLTIHLGGVLLRHPDPERFDMIIGQLEHDLRESPYRVIRLGARDAFATGSKHDALRRAAEAHPSLTLDSTGQPARSLYFVDPLVLMADPYELDVVTQVELARLTTPLEEESSPRSRFFALDIDKINARFEDDPLERITAFLDPRCPGGLPSGQALRLQAELDRPARAHLADGLTILSFEDAPSARRFAALEEAPDLIERRLGDLHFVIRAGAEDLLDEILDETGLVLANTPFPRDE